MLSPEVLTAFQRFDSRNRPTVMAQINLADGDRIINTQALVPSGASKGSREALELRDGGNAYNGLGVTKAIDNVSEIARGIAGLHVTEQQAIDMRMKELDGTDNKRRLGANAILAVSLAVARAGAEYRQIPLFRYLAEVYGESNPNLLPTPMMNVVNGGAHAKNGLPFQEFMIVPVGAENFDHAMRMGSEVYGKLGELIGAPGVGDEGGYAPIFSSSANGLRRTYDVLQTLVDAIEQAGYNPGTDIAIALDVAASEFYKDGKYHLDAETALGAGQMIDIYRDLIREFPIISIEDGMAEGDEDGWFTLTDGHVGRRGIQIVGDDLFVTSPEIFRKGIEKGLANAVLVKLNQIGTLMETLDVMKLARQADYNVIISHRSGETEDTFISHLAVATRAGQIKAGSARGERTVKYNELLNIEQIYLPQLRLTPVYSASSPYKIYSS